jgi:cysteinyl-tRNA synthetase
MKLLNSLSRKLEKFKPQTPGQVSLYTCGPTVYDHPHLGNWRTFIFYDTLVRALKVNGFEVKQVMNITDVGHLVSDDDEGEDKLEVGAKREHKTAWEIANQYTQEFMEGLGQLNIIKPAYLPKATDHIQEQIELVKQLEAGGYTYQIADGVYYDSTKFSGYQNLFGLDRSQVKEGARVEPIEGRRLPTDFALWKLTPPGQKRDMEWNSPWGKGFPGWHLECSAMAMKYLGATLDIHTGGIDHLGTHHPNEIAQSESATGQTFARYWLHGQFLNINDKKISKSLRNYITLADIVKKGISPLAFRLLVLQAHYRTQMNFSWQSLEAAQNYLEKLYAMAARLHQVSSVPSNPGLLELLEQVPTNIAAHLANDLDTPKAIAELNQLIDYFDTNNLSDADQSKLRDALVQIDASLGLNLATQPDISAQQKEMLKQRQAAREASDFKQADELRGQIEKSGILLKDQAGSSYWYRKL